MKNYTSEVPPAKSIQKIEELLIKGGARQISKEYAGNGDVVAIAFSIKNPETNTPVYIRLPADPDAVFGYFKAQRKTYLSHTQAAALREQAKRTAWRLLWDWTAVQLSLIEMRQADLLQVFLPYIIIGESTFYKQLTTAKHQMLGYNPPAEQPAANEQDS